VVSATASLASIAVATTTVSEAVGSESIKITRQIKRKEVSILSTALTHDESPGKRTRGRPPKHTASSALNHSFI
jgi:hypothetical protein